MADSHRDTPSRDSAVPIRNVPLADGAEQLVVVEPDAQPTYFIGMSTEGARDRVVRPDAIRTVTISHDGPAVPAPAPAGKCRYCGDDSWRADEIGPVHPCCAIHARQTPGRPCPACEASRRAQRPR